MEHPRTHSDIAAPTAFTTTSWTQSGPATDAADSLPLPEDVHIAAARVAGLVRHTPLIPSDFLSTAVGRPVYLKLENLQITGSFKVRGALAALSALTPSEQRGGVITASAGNHGLGVAWAARHLAISATVVVPETAVATKVEGLHALGARVILCGATYDDAHLEAGRLAEQEGWHYVHAFSDRSVIAGQGTVVLEILADLPDLACLLAPVGGGGLIGGSALALASRSKPVRLIGVQPEHAAGMARSYDLGFNRGDLGFNRGDLGAVTDDQSFLPTLADGLAGGAVDPLTLSLCLRYVQQIARVSEDDIVAAMSALLRHDHIVAEPSGALGVAALLHRRIDPGFVDPGFVDPGFNRGDLSPSGPIVAIISGGNVEPRVLVQALQRQEP